MTSGTSNLSRGDILANVDEKNNDEKSDESVSREVPRSSTSHGLLTWSIIAEKARITQSQKTHL